jgi:CDP-glucose 4,6-dehydratase
MEKLNFKNLSFYKNKRVLITGNTGFKGSWLSIWLLSIGAKVYGISKDIPTKPSLYKQAKLDKKINTYFLDIKNIKELNKTINKIKPQIIFHLAAQAIVSKSFKKPLETFYSNSIGTANLLEYLRITKNKITTIIITSDKCYFPTKRGYYDEKKKLGGIDPYSGSKAIAEIFFENYYQSFLYKKKNISCVSVRAGNVIGGGDWTANRIVPDFFKSIKKRQKIVLRNPKSNRPWQHVMEPLAVYLFLGLMLSKNKNKNKINGESFNIGPNIKNNASVLTLIKKIINKYGQKIDISYENKNLFAETKKLNLNTSKISKAIGWKNKLNFDQTCSFITEWYKKYDKDKLSVFDETSKQIMEYVKLK